MPRAIAEHIAAAAPVEPPTYTLGRHPRRPDHPALLNTDGSAAHTFHMDATRTEISAILAARGLTLHAVGSVAQADAPAVATRRTLLAGLAGAAATLAVIAPTAAGAASHPDAELIALCAEYAQNEATYARTCWSGDDFDERWGNAEALAEASDEFQRACERRGPLGDAIINAAPVTIEGYRAKARAVAADFGGDFRPNGMGDAVMWSMVQDLLNGEDAA
jgi:hypothetical protein